jgi:UDP-hydrolysing UDP-N-acetyl-D-glucosamine 2-epimerase
MGKRKVLIFTGNRAEYGLQYPILKAVDKHPQLEYQLMVSGAHLDKNFGNTLEEIKNDGFRVDVEVKIEMDKDSKISTSQAIGSGILSITKALEKLKPDIMAVYADRFEGFAAVVAATQMSIPTVHIEGGDITEGGALDDSVRHAMTKLSHIHFTTNEQASNRILAMGEEPWRVHTVGFPAMDLISEGNYATSEEVEQKLSLDLGRPIVLFTQHSVTTEFEQAEEQFQPSLKAMRDLASQGVQVILTYPNNDAGGKAIIASLEIIDSESIPGIQVHRSLGRYLYHGLIALAQKLGIKVACVGNSSSGIKETPVFGCPTVNVGSRQKGRLRGENVIDTEYDAQEIVAAVNRCLNDEDFREKCRNTNNPYYLGDAGEKVASVLAKLTLEPSLIRKLMTIKGEARNGWYR